MSQKPDSDKSDYARRVPRAVVGLGASAGGITALREFFAHVSSETGIAWVVILHLSPEHDSKLAEILQTSAHIPVTQVREAVIVEPDHVYVVPPNKSLSIVDDRLTVSEVTRPEQRRAPVDVFFRALADAHGSQSVCVVLSGTGPNGSAGLKRVKEYGGLAIAQDPADAEYPDMPRNSIATGLVDFVLPVAQMPPRIIDFVDGLRRSETEVSDDLDDSHALREIMTTLRVRTGHEFSNYKSATLRRRIQRRIHLRGVTDINEYARLIRQNPDEGVALMKELLISVTNFFRDPQAWTALEERILPRLFLTKTMHDQIRVWVAGCATGEEAYSLAMILSEYQATAMEQPSIQVFGTDLDEHAIAIAREGLYTDAEVADVSEERLQRFFHKQSGGYRVRRDLRETLLFAPHNLIKDPPFSHLDLISCRNLLIYLNRSVQERVIETFHFALRPGGYLFLGSSESPDGTNDLFRRLDGAAHLYESRSVASRLIIPVGEGPISLPQLPVRVPEPRPADRISPADLHQRLLEEYAPPSLVVTEEYNVVHMSAQVGKYLQVSGGEPSRDVIRMAHADLRADLRSALSQAARERARVEVPNVVVGFDDGRRAVDITVRPVLRETDPVRGYFVIMFRDSSVQVPPEPTTTLGGPREPFTLQLEEELQRVKGQLRVTVEQYETQAEEAKASNEELQAMNEELRSAAEELETSKEELQSVNEELTTVNQELKIKIEELRLTNNDFQNFINSTDIGTIFLDRSLRVKLFTPRSQDIFNLLDSDVGRPLSDITSRLDDERIHLDVRNVLERLQTVEREVETYEGRYYQMRMLPYRTLEDRIEGVVLTFQDTSSRRKAEQRLRDGEERLRVLIDSATDYAIFTFNAEGRIDFWNAGAERLFGYRSDEVLGRSIEMLFTPEDREAGVPAKEIDVARRDGRASDERFHLKKDGTRFYVSGVTTRIGGDTSGRTEFAKIARDLTEMRRTSEELAAAHSAVENRVRARTLELERQKTTISDLLRRVVNAQEDERARIARDLHDSVGQQLTALRLTLERHQERCKTKEADSALADAVGLTRVLSRDIEFLAWELRPTALDDLGIEKALPRFLEAWSAHVGVVADFRLNGFESGQLRRDLEVAFYRIVQEALNNVAKHAHATRADVLLSSTNGQIVLVVEDDGVGFEPSDAGIPERGIGLASMRERAALAGATLDIESTPGRGTSVFIRAPIQAAGVRGALA